ncbi:4Fe-4S binding protein [Marinobacter sp.]|uniref:4Fe-4S binding protein n=1 Tax=Marinobacter sp. TaxID=50741 RepID=UPI003567B4A9
MSEILKVKESLTGYWFKNNESPSEVKHEVDRTEYGELTLDNGEVLDSPCVLCHDIFCINAQIDDDVFDVLEVSQTKKLCPVDAIEIENKSIVVGDSCISCGLCVVSCPIGALKFNENNVVSANNARDSLSSVADRVSLSDFQIISYDDFEVESEKFLRSVISGILKSKSKTLTINRLITKAMSKLGVPTYLTRQGDVNLRMDAISRIGTRFYLVEIETLANLDSPRDILDDVAVFCSRYDVDKELVTGIIVLTELPNKRTEYWELIDDIERVTGVRILTVPLAGILTLLWNNSELIVDDFFLSAQNTSGRNAVEKSLGRKLNLPESCNLIEAAK